MFTNLETTNNASQHSEDLLRAYHRHASDVLDQLEAIKELDADGDFDIDRLLCVSKDSLTYLISAIEPGNNLAIALVNDADTIDCRIDRTEFLLNAASAVVNQLSDQLKDKNSN